jgi:hypothetical protein
VVDLALQVEIHIHQGIVPRGGMPRWLKVILQSEIFGQIFWRVFLGGGEGRPSRSSRSPSELLAIRFELALHWIAVPCPLSFIDGVGGSIKGNSDWAGGVSGSSTAAGGGSIGGCGWKL